MENKENYQQNNDDNNNQLDKQDSLAKKTQNRKAMVLGGLAGLVLIGAGIYGAYKLLQPDVKHYFPDKNPKKVFTYQLPVEPKDLPKRLQRVLKDILEDVHPDKVNKTDALKLYSKAKGFYHKLYLNNEDYRYSNKAINLLINAINNGLLEVLYKHPTEDYNFKRPLNELDWIICRKYPPPPQEQTASISKLIISEIYSGVAKKVQDPNLKKSLKEDAEYFLGLYQEYSTLEKEKD